MPVRGKSARLKARPNAPVEAAAKTITVLPSGSEDLILNMLTADLSKARRRFAFALKQHEPNFRSVRARLHAPENGDYFEKHKKQWIQDVCASLTNRHGQLRNLQQQVLDSEAPAAVDRASQLMAPVVNDECNLLNVLNKIAFLDYLPAGIPQLYGRDFLKTDQLSELLERVVRSEFEEIRKEALVRTEQPSSKAAIAPTLLQPPLSPIPPKASSAATSKKKGRPQSTLTIARQRVIADAGAKGFKGKRYCEELFRRKFSTSVAWQQNENCPKQYLDAYMHPNPEVRKKWRARIADEKYKAEEAAKLLEAKNSLLATSE